MVNEALAQQGDISAIRDKDERIQDANATTQSIDMEKILSSLDDIPNDVIASLSDVVSSLSSISSSRLNQDVSLDSQSVESTLLAQPDPSPIPQSSFPAVVSLVYGVESEKVTFATICIVTTF